MGDEVIKFPIEWTTREFTHPRTEEKRSIPGVKIKIDDNRFISLAKPNDLDQTYQIALVSRDPVEGAEAQTHFLYGPEVIDAGEDDLSEVVETIVRGLEKGIDPHNVLELIANIRIE